MKSIKITPFVSLICVALIVMLFTYTAVSKLVEHEKFVFQMRLSPFYLIKNSAHTLGWLIPALEMTIVAALLSSHWRNAGLKASLALLLIFEVYIGTMLLAAIELPCTCGGVLAQMGWATHLIFNACFLALTLIGLAYRPPERFQQAHSIQNIQRVNR